jgi:hypothetical protein
MPTLIPLPLAAVEAAGEAAVEAAGLEEVVLVPVQALSRTLPVAAEVKIINSRRPNCFAMKCVSPHWRIGRGF